MKTKVSSVLIHHQHEAHKDDQRLSCYANATEKVRKWINHWTRISEICLRSRGCIPKTQSSCFPSHYKALRKDYQNNADGFDTPLRARCSRNFEEPANKRQRMDSLTAENEGDELSDEEVIEEKPVKDESRLQFSPLHFMSVWKEPDTMTKRVKVAIVFPSGIESRGFSLRFINGGEGLELSVRWPKPLVNLQLMHKKWLSDSSASYELYHPEYVGFQDSLKFYRARSTDWIESFARISLRFVVETHIYDKHNLAWRNSPTLLVYVRLKAVVEHYTVRNDEDSFDVL